MARKIQGGPAVPVKTVTSGQVQDGPAIPVHGYVAADGKKIQGGPAQNIFVVTDPNYPVQSGPAVPVYVIPTSSRRSRGGPAIPVKLVSGSLGTPVGTVTSLPFTDLFDRANGDLANGWTYTAGKWTIAGNSAVGTPAVSVTELVTNGEFSSNTNGWTPTNASLASVAGGQAGNCLEVTNTAGSSGYATNTSAITVLNNMWYEASVYHKNGTTWANIRIGNAAGGTQYASLAALNDSDWTKRTKTIISLATAIYFRLSNYINTPTNTTLFDTVSVKALTFVDMICTRQFSSPNIDISVPLTAITKTGIIICADSPTAPLNFMIAFHDGTNCGLIDCVNGTYNFLIAATAAAYADGRTLRVSKNGNAVGLMYNGTQIGSTIDITGKPYVNNTYHGLFSGNPGNSLASFTAVAPTTFP